MSTARANTLANLAGTDSPDIIGGELSRLRINFNGTGTIAARDSFNVSSIVDGGTGSYQVNAATAFPNTDYAILASGCSPSGGGPDINSPFVTSSSTIDLRTSRTTAPGTLADSQQVFVGAFGDKP